MRQGLGIGNAMLTDYLVFENAGLRVVFMNMPKDARHSAATTFRQNGFVFINSNLRNSPSADDSRNP